VSGRPRATAALAAGVAALALVWILGPGSAPPLYDTGPIVAEHYRYLHAPAGFTVTKPPGTIDATLKLEGGQSPAMAETTDEQPAQAQILAAQGSFVVPPGTTAVHVLIHPVDPPPVKPPGGSLDGNVYTFTVAALPRGTPMTLRSGQQVTVVLRGPAGVAGPVLNVWNGTAWTALDTTPLGNTAPDSYAANVSGLGDIALVAAPPVPHSDGGGGSTGIIVAVVIVAVVLAGAASVLVLRMARSR